MGPVPAACQHTRVHWKYAASPPGPRRASGARNGNIRAAEGVSGIRRLRGGWRAVIGAVDPVAYRKGCALGAIKKGHRRRAGGTVQQYAYKACGARLAVNPGFERMRTPPVIIRAAMNMYFSGEAYRDVAETLGMPDCPATGPS